MLLNGTDISGKYYRHGRLEVDVSRPRYTASMLYYLVLSDGALPSVQIVMIYHSPL